MGGSERLQIKYHAPDNLIFVTAQRSTKINLIEHKPDFQKFRIML